MQTPATPKKRCRNELGNNSLNFNGSKDVKRPNYYLDTKAVEVSAEKIFAMSNKAKKMRQKRYNSTEVAQNNLSSKENQYPNIPLEYKGSSKDQNVALKYLFSKVFGNPEQDKWHEMKLIPAISRMLKIPKSSHTSVKNRLLVILEERGAFKGSISKVGGIPPLIVDGTVQADVVSRALGDDPVVVDDPENLEI